MSENETGSSIHPRELVDAIRRGENITELLRGAWKTAGNTEEIIETAYDLQTLENDRCPAGREAVERHNRYGNEIARRIFSYTRPSSLLEAGVGRGTTFLPVLQGLDLPDLQAHGLDLSWSRVAACRRALASSFRRPVFLCTGSILHLPYEDQSFDLVYTSHAIEPNGGREAEILAELYRVASRYLFLLEPGYELASGEARRRMEELGYSRGLVQQAESTGMNVVAHEPFPFTANPLNPTALTVIAKNPEAPPATPRPACPRFGDPLTDHGDSFFSRGSLRAYPKIQGIPCLRPEDAVIAGAYLEFLDRD